MATAGSGRTPAGPRAESYFLGFLALWPGTSFFTTWCLSDFICKMG